MKSEKLPCPVCGSPPVTAAIRKGSSYLHCHECGLLYRTGDIELEDTTVYYKPDGGNPLDRVDRAKLRLHRSVLRRAEWQLGGPGRLLDVGCSSGAFLKAASDRGWEVVGIEPVGELAEAAAENGFEVIKGTLADAPDVLGSFDLVTHWDVLVLVSDPRAELDHVKRFLAPNGLWYARLRQHAIVRAIEAIWPITGGLLGVTDPTVYHPLNFEPRTIKRLLQESAMAGEVRGGRLTRGDSYSIGRGWRRALVNVGKILFNTVARVVESISGGWLILSPTMDVWGRRAV
jgi:SAM-dependent methyltransferase